MGVERADFYQELYVEESSKRSSKGLEHALHLGEEARLAALCKASATQDAFSCRALHRARRLSDYLLSDRGELIKEFEVPGYLAPPDGESDHLITDHFRHILSFLKKNRQALAPFSLPVCGRWIEELICHSLQLPVGKRITVRDVRRAVLSALLTPLRQSVGSCFATAPAILIQREQPENFLNDLLQIMTRGKLSRTFGGVEHTVPVSPSWGHGDLHKKAHPLAPGLQQEGLSKIKRGETVLELLDRADDPERAKAIFKGVTEHALLKVWEFTVASLSDLKHEFYKWNLFASLGFDMNEPGGIGAAIAGDINERIASIDSDIQKHREEALLASDRARMTAALLKQADSPERARRFKMEHQAHAHHMESSQDLYEKGHKKGERLKELFTFLFEQYTQGIPDYFQEVYDPEMFDVPEEQFEDSPAGFRLVYKYGRRDPSSWSPIRNEEEYVDALCDFFRSIEPTLLSSLDWKEGEEIVAAITTKVIHHLRSNDFLKPALKRVAALHAKAGIDPSLKEKKKPWSYISGGSMNDLLTCYYGRESGISEEHHRPENTFDLITFLIDLIKNLPRLPATVLMHSPTHAFLLKPYYPLLHEGWKERGFTYTWVRDQVITQGESFYRDIRLDRDEQEFVMRRVGLHMRGEHAALSVSEIRRRIVEQTTIQAHHVDGILRQTFPLISAREWPQLAREVLTDMMAPEGAFAALEAFAEGPEETITAKMFANLILSAWLKGHNSLLFSQSPYLELQKSLQKRKLIPPQGLVFADTNWSDFSFGVVYNPATKEAELWRMDALGMWGVPMANWTTEKKQQHPWGVLIKPDEYSSLVGMKPHHKKV